MYIWILRPNVQSNEVTELVLKLFESGFRVIYLPTLDHLETEKIPREANILIVSEDITRDEILQNCIEILEMTHPYIEIVQPSQLSPIEYPALISNIGTNRRQVIRVFSIAGVIGYLIEENLARLK